MTFVRFWPVDDPESMNQAYVHFIRQVNKERSGTFREPEIINNMPGPGYQTEVYAEAHVVHGPGDEGVRIVAKSAEAAQAMLRVANRLGVHVEAGQPIYHDPPAPSARPKRRPDVQACLSIGDRNYTGYREIATTDDTRYIKVESPQIPWLRDVQVTLSDEKRRTDTIEIEVQLTDENQRSIRLIVHSDGQVILNH